MNFGKKSVSGKRKKNRNLILSTTSNLEFSQGLAQIIRTYPKFFLKKHTQKRLKEEKKLPTS
jgi:hypothetical protein